MVEWVNTLLGVAATAIVSGVTGGYAATKRRNQSTNTRLTTLETQMTNVSSALTDVKQSQARTEVKVDTLVFHLIPRA